MPTCPGKSWETVSRSGNIKQLSEADRVLRPEQNCRRSQKAVASSTGYGQQLAGGQSKSKSGFTRTRVVIIENTIASLEGSVKTCTE
ncbi:hypothetical protein J6590_061339 [Homalodisca vitripennis]|nr:hypothetical protein J6590_061339 [Homalodisca vitripennis]